MGLIDPPFKGYAPGWQIRCPRCRLTFDAADLGMVFIGKYLIGPERKLLWCQQCRWPRWMVVEPKPPDLPEKAGPRCGLDFETPDHNAGNTPGAG